MSTRGYLTIIDHEKNIVAAAFQPSSAYPSYLGIQVLDSLNNGTFSDFIKDCLDSYPHEKDMVDGIQRSWYVRSSENKDDFFHDYAYEYDLSSRKLNVYHFGDKALTITGDKVNLYRYLFENEEKLYYPLCLNKRSMTLKNDFYEELQAKLKVGWDIEDFKELVEKSPSVLYIDSFRLKDHTMANSSDRSFVKMIELSDKTDRMKIIAQDYGSFKLYLQTPFSRDPLESPRLTSATAVEKHLADLVRTRPDDIRGTISLYGEIDKYLKGLNDIFADKETFLEEKEKRGMDLRFEMYKTLNESASSIQLLGPDEAYLRNEISLAFGNRYTKERNRLEKEAEKKSSLSDMIGQASQKKAVDIMQDKQSPEMVR